MHPLLARGSAFRVPFLNRLRRMRSGAGPPTFQKVPGGRKCPLPPRPRAATNAAADEAQHKMAAAGVVEGFVVVSALVF